MKQDSATKLRDDGAGVMAQERVAHPGKPYQREQVLRKASAQFAMTGLHRTTTLTLAQAAEIPENVLYLRFGDKTSMFREAIEINIETRLRSLDSRLSSIGTDNQIDCIESMAEATMMNCLDGAANAILMSWALLEAPEFAKDLYRNEIGSVRILWDRKSLGGSPLPGREKLSRSTSFHMRSTLAREFAISIAKSASTVLGPW
jgi:AcrR family transcriptional regulator